MQTTIVGFIWANSKRRQIMALLVTILSFPFVYASLELPKRIVNDAIGGSDADRTIFGYALDQIPFLLILCFAFLAAVCAQGLLKMRINTMKGIIAERLLQSLRGQLIRRTMLFPKPYMQRTSQGELVSMITAETEPLGGLMGDLIAQPVFQGGMMITITGFLFAQNVWFGFAAVALIPLQAWLIPRLQQRINRLNKRRVQEVRMLAQAIGENANAAQDLRVNGGVLRRISMVDNRLERLFDLRLEIYRKKFFMKFINNLIGQLTPFLFFSIGGYLVIQGQLTVGALVAALAAYKDLAAPWKDLLTWYNQLQDVSTRWVTLTERFDPPDMLSEDVFDANATSGQRLKETITFENVSLVDEDGRDILQDVSFEVSPGEMVAFVGANPVERRSIAELLTREQLPTSGDILIGDRNLNDLYKRDLLRHISIADRKPYVFSGTIGDNLTLSLFDQLDDEEIARDGLQQVTVNPQHLEWWRKLTEAMGTWDRMLQSGLDQRFHVADRPDLAKTVVQLRVDIAMELAKAGLEGAAVPLDLHEFHPGLTYAGNLMFAEPLPGVTPDQIAANDALFAELQKLELADFLFDIGRDASVLLLRVFGGVHINHPITKQLKLPAQQLDALMSIAERVRDRGAESLSDNQKRLLIALTFVLTPEQLGVLPEKAAQSKLVSLRLGSGLTLLATCADTHHALSSDTYCEALTVLENLLFAKLTERSGDRYDRIQKTVADVLNKEGIGTQIANLVFQMPTTVGGGNLDEGAHERISLLRAAIKQPDILVLDDILGSHDRTTRSRVLNRLQEILPQTTVIVLQAELEDDVEQISHVYSLADGQFGRDPQPKSDRAGDEGLDAKIRLLEQIAMFKGLDSRQIQLLAFGSSWVSVGEGAHLFSAGDPPDGAYVLQSGSAQLMWPDEPGFEDQAFFVHPNRLIGDLAVFRGEPRRFNLVAAEPVRALRVDAETFIAVLEHDPSVAMAMLKLVSGHLMSHTDRLRAARSVDDAPK